MPRRAPCGAFARQRRQHDGRGAGFRDFLCLLPAQENRASRGTLPVICMPQKNLTTEDHVKDLTTEDSEGAEVRWNGETSRNGQRSFPGEAALFRSGQKRFAAKKRFVADKLPFILYPASEQRYEGKWTRTSDFRALRESQSGS